MKMPSIKSIINVFDLSVIAFFSAQSVFAQTESTPDYQTKNLQSAKKLISTLSAIEPLSKNAFETEEQFENRKNLVMDGQDKVYQTFEYIIPFSINPPPSGASQPSLFYSPDIQAFAVSIPVSSFDLASESVSSNPLEGQNSYGAKSKFVRTVFTIIKAANADDDQRYWPNYFKVPPRSLSGPVRTSISKEPCFTPGMTRLSGCTPFAIFPMLPSDAISVSKSIAAKFIMRIELSSNSFKYEDLGIVRSATINSPEELYGKNYIVNYTFDRVVFFDRFSGKELYSSSIMPITAEIKAFRDLLYFETPVFVPKRLNPQKSGVYGGFAELKMIIPDESKCEFGEYQRVCYAVQVDIAEAVCADKSRQNTTCPENLLAEIRQFGKAIGFSPTYIPKGKRRIHGYRISFDRK